MAGLEPIDASTFRVPLSAKGSAEYPVHDSKAVREFAKKAHAELIVIGNFDAFGNGVGVSL